MAGGTWLLLYQLPRQVGQGEKAPPGIGTRDGAPHAVSPALKLSERWIMPAEVSAVRSARNRVGALVHNGASFEQIEAARRDLALARAEAGIKKIIDQAPPLTPEQRLRLAALFVTGPTAKSAS